jgi:hypothetical protein
MYSFYIASYITRLLDGFGLGDIWDILLFPVKR